MKRFDASVVSVSRASRGAVSHEIRAQSHGASQVDVGRGHRWTIRHFFPTLCLATALSGCTTEPMVTQVDKVEQVVPDLIAETLTIQASSWPTIVRCQGTLYADEDSAIGARVAGRVSQVHVDLGDTVQAGEPLVTLETDEFELLVSQAAAQLEQARSAVGLVSDDLVESLEPENSPPVRQERAVWDEAKASLQRAENLAKQGAISQGEFDLIASAEAVAEARYAAAVNAVREKLSLIGIRRVELALARQRLADAVIHAPFDGMVQNRRVAPGRYISAGDAVVSLVRTDPIWFRGSLPERHASQLTIGLDVHVRLNDLQDPIVAQITRISPSLDLASRSLAFEAKIANPNRALRAGVFANGDIVLNPDSKSLVVPVSAITEFAGAEKVWKLIDGIAQQLEISTGGRRDGMVEIIGGLASGDQVLMDASVGRVARVMPSTPLQESKELAAARPTAGIQPDSGGT